MCRLLVHRKLANSLSRTGQRDSAKLSVENGKKPKSHIEIHNVQSCVSFKVSRQNMPKW
jgi:hypothetical protein